MLSNDEINAQCKVHREFVNLCFNIAEHLCLRRLKKRLSLSSSLFLPFFVLVSLSLSSLFFPILSFLFSSPSFFFYFTFYPFIFSFSFFLTPFTPFLLIAFPPSLHLLLEDNRQNRGIVILLRGANH